MKFTSKKTVSEIILDLEDGCIIKLTKFNLINLTCETFATQCEKYFVINIELNNGLSINLKTSDTAFMSDLQTLISGG